MVDENRLKKYSHDNRLYFLVFVTVFGAKILKVFVIKYFIRLKTIFFQFYFKKEEGSFVVLEFIFYCIVINIIANANRENIVQIVIEKVFHVVSNVSVHFISIICSVVSI